MSFTTAFRKLVNKFDELTDSKKDDLRAEKEYNDMVKELEAKK